MKLSSMLFVASLSLALAGTPAADAATPAASKAGTAVKKSATKPATAATRTGGAKTAVRTVAKPGVKRPTTAKTTAAKTTAKTTPVKPHTGLVWNSVTQGFAAAKKSNKPILVDFYTDWCGWCKVMDEVTFESPQVKSVLAKQFVLVRANAEDGADGEKLARNFEVRGFPTTMLFDASGKPKAVMMGFVKPDVFGSRLDEFLHPKPQTNPASDSTSGGANSSTTTSGGTAGGGTTSPQSETQTNPPSTPFKE